MCLVSSLIFTCGHMLYSPLVCLDITIRGPCSGGVTELGWYTCTTPCSACIDRELANWDVCRQAASRAQPHSQPQVQAQAQDPENWDVYGQAVPHTQFPARPQTQTPGDARVPAPPNWVTQIQGASQLYAQPQVQPQAQAPGPASLYAPAKCDRTAQLERIDREIAKGVLLGRASRETSLWVAKHSRAQLSLTLGVEPTPAYWYQLDHLNSNAPPTILLRPEPPPRPASAPPRPSEGAPAGWSLNGGTGW